jgi:hypothetical protein
MTLLSRTEFRNAVFDRDQQTCVVCLMPGQDAHHIMERRLFPDGGYYLDNGATVCGTCHISAEETSISTQTLYRLLGDVAPVLPPHFYPDQQYDKWGNILLPNGRRLPGELFEDGSVQKVLAKHLYLFDTYVKYPRTMHLPWSESVTEDDRIIDGKALSAWNGTEVVVTEKMDGECTTMYSDYIHARSVDFTSHVSRSWVQNLHAQIRFNIPKNFRICGENLWATHSIHYTQLPSYFMVYSIWDGLRCLSWNETVEWCELLGLQHVPELYRGLHEQCLYMEYNPARRFHRPSEGYVVRPAGSFVMAEFPRVVAKYVRKNHVQTHGHWMRSTFVPNELA